MEKRVTPIKTNRNKEFDGFFPLCKPVKDRPYVDLGMKHFEQRLCQSKCQLNVNGVWRRDRLRQEQLLS